MILQHMIIISCYYYIIIPYNDDILLYHHHIATYNDDITTISSYNTIYPYKKTCICMKKFYSNKIFVS